MMPRKKNKKRKKDTPTSTTAVYYWEFLGSFYPNEESQVLHPRKMPDHVKSQKEQKHKDKEVTAAFRMSRRVFLIT